MKPRICKHHGLLKPEQVYIYKIYRRCKLCIQHAQADFRRKNPQYKEQAKQRNRRYAEQLMDHYIIKLLKAKPGGQLIKITPEAIVSHREALLRKRHQKANGIRICKTHGELKPPNVYNYNGRITCKKCIAKNARHFHEKRPNYRRAKRKAYYEDHKAKLSDKYIGWLITSNKLITMAEVTPEMITERRAYLIKKKAHKDKSFNDKTKDL